MTYVSLFPYVGKGPAWPKDGVEVDYCKNSWYLNFLYVNNLFVDGYDMVCNLFYSNFVQNIFERYLKI